MKSTIMMVRAPTIRMITTPIDMAAYIVLLLVNALKEWGFTVRMYDSEVTLNVACLNTRINFLSVLHDSGVWCCHGS